MNGLAISYCSLENKQHIFIPYHGEKKHGKIIIISAFKNSVCASKLKCWALITQILINNILEQNYNS